MSKGVVVDGDLAAQVRRLAGARSARAAAETVLREYVRRNAAARPDEAKARAKKNGGRKPRDDRQAEFLQETAFAAARNGDPFYPGFNPKKLWKPRDFN